MKTNQNPLVSIILVNYNGKNYLQKCIESILSNEYKEYEIILVDNNSNDKSVQMVIEKFPKVKIIKLEKNYGFAEPNNIGAKLANGDLFYFLNNDTTLCDFSISELVKVILEPEIAICQSLLLKPDGKIDSSGDFFTTKGFAYSSTKETSQIRPILSARGASMMVKKEIFWKLGGFDKKFFASFEDVDLGWRAWVSGYKVVLAPKSIVYHTGGQTGKKLNSLIRFHGVKNTLVLCIANFEMSYAVKSLFSLGAAAIGTKIFGSNIERTEKPFSFPSFRFLIQGVNWILRNFKYVSKKRRQVNSQRIRSTNELVKLNLITKGRE